MPRIAVVIPMYGQENYTDKCVDVTLQNAGVDVDIIVVDDGSKVPYKNDKVTVIRLNENSGFTKANNAGMLKALDGKYDYIHLLNNDTEPYPNFIKYLLDVMEKSPNIGIASSLRYYPIEEQKKLLGVDKIEEAYYEYFGADLITGYQMVCVESAVVPHEVIHCNWVPVCSSLVSVDMVKHIGLLNTKMRTHSSDVEYCIRAKILGYKVVVVTDSRVIHYHQVTTRHEKIQPYGDQAEWLRILSGIYYAEFMKEMPLDCNGKLYGKLEFSTYNK